jgi:hypothetical protein
MDWLVMLLGPLVVLVLLAFPFVLPFVALVKTKKGKWTSRRAILTMAILELAGIVLTVKLAKLIVVASGQ